MNMHDPLAAAELMAELAQAFLVGGETGYWTELRTAWALRAAGHDIDEVRLGGLPGNGRWDYAEGRRRGRLVIVAALEVRR